MGRVQTVAGVIRGNLSIDNVKKALSNPGTVVRFARNQYGEMRKSQLDYDEERRELPKRLSGVLPASEDELKRYQQEIRSDPEEISEVKQRTSELIDGGSTSTTDCESLYVTCRALKPDVVVTTGTFVGKSDAFVLHALEKNGKGEHHSLDLEENGAGVEHGTVIPDEYRDRWELHLGDAKDILEDILEEFGPVGLFHHDSLHTPEHMIWEYETALPHIESGAITSHDVMMTSAFRKFAEANSLSHTRVANFGVCQVDKSKIR